jgi:hypothetical protein
MCCWPAQPRPITPARSGGPAGVEGLVLAEALGFTGVLGSAEAVVTTVLPFSLMMMIETIRVVD